MKKETIFLDANILFSAAYREESGLLKLWKLPSVKVVSSAYAIEEAERNLDLLEQNKRLKELIKLLDVHHSYSQGIKIPKSISLKEKDQPILLAALASKANYLITGDMRDFGKFYGKNIGGVIILPLAEYLKNKKEREHNLPEKEE